MKNLTTQILNIELTSKTFLYLFQQWIRRDFVLNNFSSLATEEKWVALPEIVTLDDLGWRYLWAYCTPTYFCLATPVQEKPEKKSSLS